MDAIRGTDRNQAKRSRTGARAGREAVGRERVMQVALEQFVANGYSGTSLKTLANELGISPPALYWYFPSKEELYVTVIEQAMSDFSRSVYESLTDDDPVFRLSQLVRAHVTWQLEHTEIARAFDLMMTLRQPKSDIPESRLAPIFKMENDYLEEVRSILRNGVDEGLFAVDDIKTTAFAIINLCEYVTSWYKPGGELSIGAVANRYEGLVRRMVGVAPRRTTRPDGLVDDSSRRPQAGVSGVVKPRRRRR
jgi:TetR/AcrR family transcriptional regulator, cholesterol catabolism regulator